jgi:hypothetical protein
MKKALPIVVVLLVLGTAAFVFFQKRQAESRVRATALAPAETILFVHLPDIRQSAIRWPKTSLAQIGNEPEVQAFMERPKEKLGWLSEMTARIDQISQASPREAFLAVTSLDDKSVPTFVGGFSFSGNRAAVEDMLDDTRATVRNNWPAGKADIISYAGAEIETYTDKDLVIAETIRDGWYLVSNQVELLQATLDRLDGKPGLVEGLTRSDLYQSAVGPQPGDAEAVIYARLDSLADKVVPLLSASGQKMDPSQIEELRKTKAISASIKFDGAQIRDSMFVLKPDQASVTPLARRGMDLSTTDTLLYYVTALSEKMEISPETTGPLAIVLPALPAMEQALTAKGMKLSDIGSIFGPEMSALVNWVQTDVQPSFMIGFDVRDSVRAKAFLEAAATPPAGGEGWGRKEQGETLIYTLPPQGLLPAPVMALSQNFLIVGFSEATVNGALERLHSKTASLGGTDSFQQATKLVGAPTEAFGFLDTGRLFERAYGMLRPFVAMTLAFSPEAGQYMDVGKLPTTEVISKHLTPSVYSQTSTPQGTLIESAGTLTFNQAVIGVMAGGIASALPNLKDTMSALQGIPGAPPAGSPSPGNQNPLLPPGSAFPPQADPTIQPSAVVPPRAVPESPVAAKPGA